MRVEIAFSIAIYLLYSISAFKGHTSLMHLCLLKMSSLATAVNTHMKRKKHVMMYFCNLSTLNRFVGKVCV
jgi:hypothetical protein